MAVLPNGEFDSQVFIDAFGIRWVYRTEDDCWHRDGKVSQFPLANLTTTGLLSKEFKYMLDTVVDKGGGFALVMKPLLQKRSQSNPDGVIFGDVEFVSESLKIACVDSQGNIIQDACGNVSFKENDDHPPGFDLSFSDDFLKSFCVEVPGGPGPTGPDGFQGETGDDGTGDGPVGLKGISGKDADVHYKLTGIKITDVDDISDTAVVKLELDKLNGVLTVTKSKVKVPDEEDATADQIIARQVMREIRFTGDCWKYGIVKIPCGPGDTYDTLDPTIAYYPSHFQGTESSGTDRFQLVRKKFSDLVDQIIDWYQAKLDECSDQYDTKIEAFIKEKDAEARAQLDTLGDRLTECENITYLDYCIGLNQNCSREEEDGQMVDDDSCTLLAESIGFTCPVGSSVRCNSSAFIITARIAPILSFDAPAAFKYPSTIASPSSSARICETGCWVMFNDGSNAVGFVPRGGAIPPDSLNYSFPGRIDCGGVMGLDSRPPQFRTDIFGGVKATDLAASFQTWASNLAGLLNSAHVIYDKTQLMFAGSKEFQPGTYVFMYSSGAFRQDRLNSSERFGESQDSNLIINGDFQNYFVGNEGSGHTVHPLYILNPFDLNQRIEVNGPLTSTEIGLEIGVAPTTYSSLIPSNYFTSHPFVPSNIGAASADVPLPHVDYVGLSALEMAPENLIHWSKFPTSVTQGHYDEQELLNAYQNGPISSRVLVVTIAQPSFLFARVKLAYSGVNFFGNLIMPPTTAATQDFNKAYSYNRAVIYKMEDNKWPVVNARPVANGQVRVEIVKVACQ